MGKKFLNDSETHRARGSALLATNPFDDARLLELQKKAADRKLGVSQLNDQWFVGQVAWHPPVAANDLAVVVVDVLAAVRTFLDGQHRAATKFDERNHGIRKTWRHGRS
jgi:hypothetical protein